MMIGNMIGNMIGKVAKATAENGESSLGGNDPSELNLRSMQATMAAYHIHGNDLIHSSRIRRTNLRKMKVTPQFKFASASHSI